MEKNFEELRGDEKAAIEARQQIGKYFQGLSGHKDALKYQLVFASRIMHTIVKCELKHINIYIDIITDVFGDVLKPESSPKYWSSYVNCMRYFHYLLVTKKHYKAASQTYHYICSYDNKLQTEDDCMTIINLYYYHLYLQNSYLQIDREKATVELNHVVENLTHLFEEMLERNKSLNLQYKDVLQKTISWLFPHSNMAKYQQFFMNVTGNKMSAFFAALFKLNAQQRLPPIATEEILQKAKFIVETLALFLVYDVSDNFHLQLSVQLLKYCRLDSHLQSHKPISEIFVQLYEYLRLISSQEPTVGFESLIKKHCYGFKTLFELHSKSIMNQSWFKDLLALLNNIHTQMQNTTVFACFWRQMTTMSCYQALLTLLLETMKLAPSITAETKLNTIHCCSSFRKHVILSFANTALSTFVLYCQTVKNEPPEEATTAKDSEGTGKMQQPMDVYNEMLHKPLILIIGNAFKVIDKMECIVSTSDDINQLLMRFKQAALSAGTARQAKTCIELCELFLRITHKIPDVEWPLLLRRVYKAVAECQSQNYQLIREMQMCYIASLFQLPTEMDFNQIRGQISIYYYDSYKDLEQKPSAQPPPPPHEKCLVDMMHQSTHNLRPNLKLTRRKLLHWFEVQHAVKYYKSNTNLMKSLIQSSQSYYDYVITTRAAKVSTTDTPKFISIYKYLRSKPSDLSRLEHLMYGHCCTKLLQEYADNSLKSGTLDSKDFNEDQLEQLLLRKEMETMTICHELQYVKMAYDGFVAFEKFYNKYDEEQISSDDAILDWLAILNDLTALAQFLHYSSYMEYASHVWKLHYKIAQFLGDGYSALKGLTFFCEYSTFYEDKKMSDLELDKEIQLNMPTITNTLTNLANFLRTTQTCVLLVTLQIAYYYARTSKYTFAQMLLQFVEEKHCELPDRRGTYDIVMATLDIIRYRLLWKHCGADTAKKSVGHSSKAENLLLNQCLMGDIERILDRVRDFVFFVGDGCTYNLLITSLAQDLPECSANRLYESFLSPLIVAACKCSLQSGFALRMAQVMSTWMWLNLQMEYVEAAQTKLKIIEYIMGIKSLKELSGHSAKAVTDVKSGCLLPVTSNDLLLGINHNPGIEATRRIAQVHLSPIKTGKLQLRPESQKTDLKKYFKFKVDTKTLPQNEQLDWMYFTIGCLNARLYFLVEDYVQLETFYERGSLWLEKRQSHFNKRYFKNVHLLAVQHYANFLRANHQQEKACLVLNYGLELCMAMQLDIDVVYRVNFKLQLMAAQEELQRSRASMLVNGKIKRALKFNVSPEEEKYQCEKSKRMIQDSLLQQVVHLHKRRADPVVVVVSSGSSTTSTTKPPKMPVNSNSSSSSSSPEAKCKIKSKLKFNICEDAIEIIESDDNDGDVKAVKTSSRTDAKITKASKSIKSSQESYTPKIPRKNTTKSGTKSITKMCPNLNDNQFIDSIDLLDTPPAPAPAIAITKNISATSSSSSSMENLHTKENHAHNDLDLIKKLENLELVDKSKKTKTTRTRRACKSPVTKKQPAAIATAPVIILEDSPSIKPMENNVVPKSRSRLKSKNLPDVVADTANAMESSKRTTRRRRNLDVENNENDELNGQSSPPSSTASSSTTVSTRRRQKI